jgi:hypothetical protein
MFQNLDLQFLLFYCLVIKKIPPLFTFGLSVLLPFFFFLIYFFIAILFHPHFVPIFLAHVISSLAYPTCLRLKGLVVVVFLPRSRVQVLKTTSCENAGKGYIHKTQSGQTLP